MAKWFISPLITVEIHHHVFFWKDAFHSLNVAMRVERPIPQDGSGQRLNKWSTRPCAACVMVIDVLLQPVHMKDGCKLMLLGAIWLAKRSVSILVMLDFLQQVNLACVLTRLLYSHLRRCGGYHIMTHHDPKKWQPRLTKRHWLVPAECEENLFLVLTLNSSFPLMPCGPKCRCFQIQSSSRLTNQKWSSSEVIQVRPGNLTFWTQTWRFGSDDFRFSTWGHF